MNIGIYIYEHAEVLDFSGPFEVFSVAKRVSGNDWNVLLIGENNQPIAARGGFNVVPHCCINSHPALDLIVVVGGDHTQEMHKPNVLAWLENVCAQASRVASVCTGVFILGNAGVLPTMPVTTHWEDQDALQSRFPHLTLVPDKRWIESGKFITSGGISAGIDMSLHLVSQLTTMDTAKRVARQMEYDWRHIP